MAQRTILLADTSSTIRKIVELTFQDTDIRVESVAAGGEALGRLAEVEADLVLAETAMSESSGYELCRSIKASERPIPVILLAGTFDPFDADLARDCGADDCLHKPFEASALRGKVELLLAGPAVAPPADRPVEPAAPPTDLEPSPTGTMADEPDPDSGDAPAPELVDAVAREVVRRLSDRVLREMAREILPDLAAEIVRERIRELESDES